MCAEITVSPNCAITYPTNAIDKKEDDFLLGQKDNFIKVNQNTGLTKREINKAIKILTRLKE